MRNTFVAVTALLMLVGTVQSQDRTDLSPLVIERPKSVGAARYLLRVQGIFGQNGLTVTKVLDGSPLQKMTRSGSPNSIFIAEPNDHVLAIRDGLGRFVTPQSPESFASIVNSLDRPQTQILIRDVQGSGNWVYNVSLAPAQGGGGGGGGGGSSGGNSKVIGQKIVVVLIGDTLDRKVGKAVASTLEGIKQALDEKTQKMHLRSAPIQITGVNLTRQEILNKLNSIPVGRNDTLLCYVNCHGAFDPKIRDYSQGHFFQMSRGANLLRRDLRQALELKGARLTCLISDACNVTADYYYSVPVQSKIMPRNKKFESLFLGPRGFVDLNSSSRGQYSFTYVFGRVFTNSLSLNGVSSLPAENPTTWKNYVSALRADTQSLFKRLRDQALKNPKMNLDTKKLLNRQTSQTVMVYSVPQ